MGMAARDEQASDTTTTAKTGCNSLRSAGRAFLPTIIMTVAASDPHTGPQAGDAYPCSTPGPLCIMKEAVQ